MPILDVELVVNEGDPPLPADLAREIADAAGEIFDQPPGECWVRLREIPRRHYAENGGGPPPEVRPVRPAAQGAPTAEQLTQIMALLEGAERPIIFAGAGFKSANGSNTSRNGR